MSQRFLVLDYETFSAHDLKKAGAFEYAAHKSTEILCAGYAVGTRDELRTAPVKLWSPMAAFADTYGPNFTDLYQNLMDPKVIIVAHNALFEQVITRFVFGLKGMYSKKYLQEIPVDRWVCTASLARSIGIPGKLEGAGAALGLRHQKDKEGHRLMLKLSKPKKPSKKDPSKRWEKREEYERLFGYCAQDVRSEIDLFLALPALPEKERKLWLLDQRMNLEGFKVDRSLVGGALKLIAHETKRLDYETQILTGGKVSSTRQRDAVLKFLKSKGVDVPNLQSATVTEVLQNPKFSNIPDSAQRILEIREAASKSSTAKYQAFEIRSRFDGRARDNTIFFGAHTGRQSGTGLQPQNLFKTVLPQDDLEAAFPLIKSSDNHAIEALYPAPMKLYASTLRSCIIAEDGHVLDVGDFATIEVRVLFWLAGHKKGLEALAAGRDLYLEMASVIFRTDLEALTREYHAGSMRAKSMRQLGKTVVLGAGFGIGWKKFLASCKQQRIDITEELAVNAVKAYRNTHARVPLFWTNIEKAALMALKAPGKRFRLGHIVWCKEKNFLTVELPIGRKLHYFDPRIRMKETPWGSQQALTYMAVNSVTKNFERADSWGGVLTENVVQAVARDLLMEALLRLDASKIYKPILSVHDEIVCERNIQSGNTKEFLKLMEQVPPWAEGIPIKVEGWTESRYRK